MALFKYVTNSYHEKDDQVKMFKYIMGKSKKNGAIYVGGSYVSVYERDAEYIYQQYLYIRNLFEENRFRQVYHFILAFEAYYPPTYIKPSVESCITAEKAYDFAGHLCEFLDIFKDRQVLWGVHFKYDKTGYREVHIHFAVNAISLCGERLKINNSILNQTAFDIYALGHNTWGINPVFIFQDNKDDDMFR